MTEPREGLLPFACPAGYHHLDRERQIGCGACAIRESELRAAIPDPAGLDGLTFAKFSATNRARCEAADGFGHPLDGWSLSDWFLAATGEFGEAANKAKKLNRERDGIPGNDETPEQLRAGLADEIADAVIYLDLAAQSQGFDLGEIIASKFNRTSEKIGAPHRLTVAATPDPAGPTYTEIERLDRPGNRANGSRAALAATEPELDVEPAFRVTDSDADYLRERMRYYHETKGGRVAHNHIECKLIATLDARLSEKGER